MLPVHQQLLALVKFCWLIALLTWRTVNAFLFYPRGSSLGYLAAVAMPLDIPHRNVYVAFNFEANYGTPPNSTYLEWVDRWNLAQADFGVGNNVTRIDGRRRYTRSAFYASFVGYANHFDLNGDACLLRTICEVAASNLDEHNGLLGSFFKILFMPSTSAPEHVMDSELNLMLANEPNLENDAQERLFDAESNGRNANCTQYMQHCPHGILDMISEWL